MIQRDGSVEKFEGESPSQPMSVRIEVHNSADAAESGHSWVLNRSALHYLGDIVMAKIWMNFGPL